MKAIVIIMVWFAGIYFFSCDAFTLAPDTINQRDKNGLRTGWWMFIENGNKLKEGRFEEGKKEGLWTFYYGTGVKKSEITYKNNRPNGWTISYYKNGNVREEGVWRNLHWTGTYKYYYEDGTLKYLWKYNESGNRIGEQKYFHSNGNVLYAGQWNNGKKDGQLLQFDSNGKLFATFIFSNNELASADSVSTDLKPKIDLAKKENREKVTTPDSLKVSHTASIETFDGNGIHTLYNKFRKISHDGYFKDGKLVSGKRYNYDQNNNLISVELLEDGKIIRVLSGNNEE